MERKETWPRLLNEYVVKAQHLKWELGVHDCCTFCAGAVKAITGIDTMAEFRGKYDSPETYAKALEEFGSGTLYKTLRAKFGKPVHGAQGRRGDIAFYEGSCGIIMGRSAFFLHKEGLGQVSITQIQRAFRV